MTDFFDQLQAQLIDAARVRRDISTSSREPIDQRPSSRLRLPGRTRPWLLVLVAGVLVATGTAIAAISIGGQRSKPLSGIVRMGSSRTLRWSRASATRSGSRRRSKPGRSAGASPRARSVATAASRTAGPAAATRQRRPLGAGPRHRQRHQWRWPVLRVYDLERRGDQDRGGPTVLTRASARLPDGYRAAVFEYEPPAAWSGPTGSRPPGLITPLSASAGRSRRTLGPPVEPTRSWLYPTHLRLELFVVGQARDRVTGRVGIGRHFACRIASIIGSAFLPCVTRDLYIPAIPATRTRLPPWQLPRRRGPARRFAPGATPDAAGPTPGLRKRQAL